jgi:hypothetical protein
MIVPFSQLCIPDWPYFNLNKVVWIDQVDKIAENKQLSKGSANAAAKTKSKKSKKDQ